MVACPGFYTAFRDNMAASGLDAPASLFGTYQTAVGTLTLLLQPLAKLGAGATVAELIGATVGLEKLMVVGALGASFYIGAAIGSLIVAADNAMVCTSGVDARRRGAIWAARHGLPMPATVSMVLFHHPEVMQPGSRQWPYALLSRARAVA
ncbi:MULTISPECIES: hypothetical protein [Burkholderia]|uniref:hypothetical protein n=1 Tax=Burkholderia TaxID=32008 RepID=UPI00055A34F1|nr:MULTISPECIES: hypothetical protein [Burkholderia]AKE03965.1 hypothetical protein XM57_14030 [Burkholderia cepacia]MCC5026907.1 hypothetical protein [Burkholderia dolosa]UEB54620.1 hypothetical protein LK423_11920 [Burkholderia dolosa]UEC14941.1 hypothetical protein LK445_24615 [Burkholderia dolosa]VWC07956.1 hypothetical protein BDO18943_05165 [Burkholderia dolosa]